METASTAIELVGLVLVAVGLGLLRLWLGLTAAGVACLLVGLALSRSEVAVPPDPDDV